MSDLAWANEETRECFVHILEDWFSEDATAIRREWQDMGNGSAVECLARQLRKDLRQEYGRGFGDRFIRSLLRAGLARINFKQVAFRLLHQTQPEENEEPGGLAESA